MKQMIYNHNYDWPNTVINDKVVRLGLKTMQLDTNTKIQTAYQLTSKSYKS